MTCDTVSVRIACPAEQALAFVADPDRLSLWSFGTWRTRIDDDGVVHGTSIKDGAAICVRIVCHPEQLLIDYLIGPVPEALQPRIFIRLARGRAIGRTDDECLLMLTALRSDDMGNSRWAGLKTAHAFEVDLIKSAIESGYDHRTTRSGQGAFDAAD